MLLELEQELITRFKTALGKQLREIKALPSVDGEQLLRQFALEAPALYVSHASGSAEQIDRVKPRLSLLLVTKNAASREAARKGDGIQIGLYALTDIVLALTSGFFPGWVWDSYAFSNESAFTEAGLDVSVVQLHCVTEVPEIPEGMLSEDGEVLPAFVNLYAEIGTTPGIKASINLEQP